jgi:hypothetical protein
MDLPIPIPVCLTNRDSLIAAYTRLAAIALDPSMNLPSSFRIPQWIKVAGVGLLMAAGIGSIVFLLIRLRRIGLK